MRPSRSRPVVPFVVILLLAWASTVSAIVHRVGAPISMTCSRQEENGFAYDPAFDAKTFKSDAYVTLFTGASPRPETEVAKWTVKREGNDFVYTLKKATIEDAGLYKCNNIIDDLHPITVVGNEVITNPTLVDQVFCPSDPPLLKEGDFFEETCSMAKAGPDPVRLKWRDASDGGLVNFTFGRDQSGWESEDGRTRSLLHMKLVPLDNGLNLECVVEGANYPDLSCSFGPLQVDFHVRADGLLDEDIYEDKVRVFLRGNPPAIADVIRVDFEENKFQLETKFFPEDSHFAVQLHFLETPKAGEPFVANVTYFGRLVKTIRFHSASDQDLGDRAASTGGDAGTIAGVVVALVLILICAVLLVILWKKKILFGAKEAEEDKLDEAEKGFTADGDDKEIEEANEIKPDEEIKLVSNTDGNVEDKGPSSGEKLEDQSPTSKPLETAT